MFGRDLLSFEPPIEELSAQSQGFSPGYEPSALKVLRVKPGYPTPLIVIRGPLRFVRSQALDKLVSLLLQS
jgi:hypothetical protein